MIMEGKKKHVIHFKLVKYKLLIHREGKGKGRKGKNGTDANRCVLYAVFFSVNYLFRLGLYCT